MTADAPIRLGIIGTGWAGEAHLKAYRLQPNTEIVAVADARQSRLDELQATYNIPHGFLDYCDMLQQVELDAVSIATPNHMHAPAAIAALEAGCHVLCEKPLATSVAEGEAMVQAAIDHERVLQVAFNHRRRGDVEALKQHIDAGGLGRIYQAKASWMRRQGIPGMGGWFTSKAKAGGGPLIDLGVHILDMALYLMGEPEVEAVSAQTYAELGPRGKGSRGDRVEGGAYEVEDLATAFIRFQDGITLLLEASWAVYGKHGDDFGVTLYGTDGGADIEIVRYSWQDTLTIYNDTGGVPAIVRPEVRQGEGHLAVIRDFLTTIRAGDWSAHVGREGLRRAQIIEACYKSAAAGRELQLTDAAAQL